MGLNKITTTQKTYLSISHGVIRHNNKTTGKVESFNSVEGKLKDIYKKTRSYNGKEEEDFWYIDLQDKQDIYSLCFMYSSGVFKSIINALCSDTELSPESIISVQPYEKNGFTKVSVFSDGVKLDWLYKEMPAIENITLPNGTNVKDDTERMKFIEGLVQVVNNRLKGA